MIVGRTVRISRTNWHSRRTSRSGLIAGPIHRERVVGDAMRADLVEPTRVQCGQIDLVTRLLRRDGNR